MAGDADADKVSLLLHMDGAEGSVAFTDSSPSPKALTVYGGAKISTAKSKFGGASAYFDGAGGYLAVANPSDFAFGTQDFTIEWWSFRTATKADALIFSTSVDGAANGGYWIDFEGNDLTMYGPALTPIIRAGGVGTADGVWNHWAVTRSGTTVRAFKNGGLLATASNATSLIATNARVGGTETFGGYDGWHNGYIDELRITKGVARYTGNYTPATEPFGGAITLALSGLVKDAANAAAARLVRALREDTGALVGRVTSDAETGAYTIPTAHPGEHTVVVYPVTGENLPALVHHGVIPI